MCGVRDQPVPYTAQEFPREDLGRRQSAAVAVLGAVLNPRFAALVPVTVGASSLPAALLLRRAERADRPGTSAA
ncbi:hypothetical protein ACIBBB_32205 [Streptomyces sp. NPDC051217]|uniref:hypothetical protein n=1 Tax=Streptomyces sp. NPDC051217 TaxID=3365644 RepID=UPI0037A23BD4